MISKIFYKFLYMKLNKYKWRNRILLINTPSYKNENYILTKNIYEKNIEEFHRYFIKLLTNRKKDIDFGIEIVDFDGKTIESYKKIIPSKIFKLFDKKTAKELNDENSKIKAQNLSLYSDYNKETTVPGLGFKDKEKALYTLNKIKNKPLKYQVNLVSTMIGRAKGHPYRNKDMNEAIKIFQKWLDNYHKTKE